MAIVGTFNGDINVTGTVTCLGFNGPAGSVTDSMIQSQAGVQATKIVHQLVKQYCQESATTSVSESRVVHVVYGNPGNMTQNANACTVIDFRAGCVVPNAGAATITVDLLKNGSSILTGSITLNNTQSAYQKVLGTISSSTLLNGDVLEVKTVATAGGGSIGKGVFAEVVLRENPL